MYETNYHRASSADDAVAKIGAADDGKFMAGGQTLIPTMKQRLASPSDVIDIGKIDAMKGISIDGNRVTIGAATIHADVAGDSKLSKACPGITSLAGHIGDPHVRNMGTIGGSIANNDPAADYPAAMLALNADIMTSKRTIPADEFFQGMFETALEADEIITAVSFDAPKKSAYAKFPNPASRYAMAGVFVANGDGGVRVAVTGAGMRRSAGEVAAAVAAGCEHHAVRTEEVQSAVFEVPRDHAAAGAVLIHHEIDGEVLDEELGVVFE